MAETESSREATVAAVPLARNLSFWGMTVAQFLGAFNDNLFKQVVLLICVDLRKAGGGDYQGVAQFLFALPFILFSGFAGFLSDRYSKRRIVVACKAAEMAIMVVGTIAVGVGSLPAALGIVFLMGTHSAFFGPSKYGILPELVPPSQLPRANGLFLMTTFLGIILGMGLAGVVKSTMTISPWLAGPYFIGFAAIGTMAAWCVRPTIANRPGMPFDLGSLFVSRETRTTILADRALLVALGVSSLFWFCGGVVQPTVNAYGKLDLYRQLAVTEADVRTSLLAACLAVGIALGCPLAGLVCRGRADFRVTITGAWGIVAGLIVLAAAGASAGPSEWVVRGLLLFVGASTGLFTVPLQVFLQSRPPADQRGRVLGAMNLVQWMAIAAAAVFYAAGDALRTACGWPISTLFAMTALVMLPVAIAYRPWRWVKVSETAPNAP